MHRQVCETIHQTLAFHDEAVAVLTLVFLNPFALEQSTQIEEKICVKLLLLKLRHHKLGPHQTMLGLVHQERDCFRRGILQLLHAHLALLAIRNTQCHEAGYVVGHSVGQMAVFDKTHR